MIQGKDTHCEYNAGLFVDERNGEIYSVALDTEDNVLVFSGDAEGNAAPQRILKTQHRLFASEVDPSTNELFVTLQHPPKVAVWRRTASGNDTPIRVLSGPKTYLHDTHGIALDFKRKLMFVGSWGNSSDPDVAGSGHVYPPSINVYPMDASGDVAPLRVIEGPKTLLDWPGGITLDPDTGNLWVANDVGGNVLVFKGTDQGDVAPTQIIEGGQKPGLSHPAGIAFDVKNRESVGFQHGELFRFRFRPDSQRRRGSASHHPQCARRQTVGEIRQAPGGGCGYQTRFISRTECRVNTPQIAAFARLAKEDTPPVSALEGQKDHDQPNRLHALGYDPIHDELIVNSPLSTRRS